MINFDFTTDYILENDKVLLRPLTAEDFDHLKTFSLLEPNLWKYSLIPADGLENLKNYMNLALKGRQEENAYPFIVFDKTKDQYAGTTRFYDMQSYHKTTQLGYTWYGKDFQGTGLNKNCKFLMLQFAFESMEVERVEFRADAKNDRSIAAMKSIGCEKEGILRSNCISPSGRRDSIIFSILRTEWLVHVKMSLSERIK